MGLALTQSRGIGGYHPDTEESAPDRLHLWGAAGYGAGEITLNPDDQAAIQTDIDWTMAAVGAQGNVLTPSEAGSDPALALVSDTLWTQTTSDRVTGLAASDSDVNRLRLGLRGSWLVVLEDSSTPDAGDGASLTPNLELGVRHDGGDAETGFGVELGGGFALVAPRLGLSLDLAGRTLLAYEDSAFKDQGVSASFAFDPNPASDRGPSPSLRQQYGGPATGGLDALFTSDPLASRISNTAASTWTAGAAYGFPAFGGRFTGSPHVGVGLDPGNRSYSLGWRLTPPNRNTPSPSKSQLSGKTEARSSLYVFSHFLRQAQNKR